MMLRLCFDRSVRVEHRARLVTVLILTLYDATLVSVLILTLYDATLVF